MEKLKGFKIKELFLSLKEKLKLKGKSRQKKLAPGRFSVLHSLQVKVMVLVAVAVIVSVFALYQVMMSSMKELLIDSARGKMLNVVTSYGKVIDKEETEFNKTKTSVSFLEPEEYGELLEGIEVEGVENFYYMMLHRSGVIR